MTSITILMTSSHFWSFARRAAAPLATFISGLAIVTTFALPATALAAPLPTPSFTTAITVAPATSTYDGTATLSATLSGSVTLLTHTYSIPLPNQTLSFSIGSHSVGTATTDAHGVATLSNVDLTGIAPPDVQTITVTYAGATYDISSLIHVTLPALSIPSATGTGTFTFTAPNPIYVNVNSATTGDDGSLTHPFHSIQAGIDAAVAGDMIYVFPGSYNETATNRTLTAADGGGTYQFGLFFPADKPGLSVVGTDSSWNPITDASAVQANVTTNGTANFGPDGVLIEGANDTIQALNIGENIGGMNKSIEVVADNFTLMDSVLSDPEGGDLYIDALNGDHATVNKYTITGNLFTLGATLDIANGAGASTAATDRVITDNTFSGASANYPYALISFDGAGGQSWYANPVGGAVITGNTFSSGGDGTKYIRTRGTVSDPSQFDWHSYWTNNTFDSSVIDLSDAGAFTPQAYSYTDGVTFTNVMEIGTSIQNELANAQAGNTILVGAGTYTGDVAPTVDNLTIEGTGAATVLNLGSGYGFNLDNPPAAITGFTLSGFTVNASNTTTYAFKAYKADGLTLTNDTFNGGAGNTGGGVDINTTSNVTFNNVTSSGFHKNGFADTPAYTSADSSAAGDNITLNSITASNDGWAGVAFYSIGGAGGAANMSHVSFTGTDIVSGNGTEGVFIEGDTDANFGAHTTPAYKVTSDGTTLDLTHVAFTGNTLYDVVNYQTAPVNAIGATFGGLTGDAMDSAGRTAEDAKIEDHLDLPALGLVSYYTPVVLTAPIVTVTPAAGSLISSTTTFTITVTGTNVDPAKNNNIWVYLYNADGSKSKGANVDLSSGTGTFTVDTTKLNDGKAWLDVGDLYGADGNHIPGGDTYFKDYIIDNTAPTVSVTPVAGSTLSGTVTFNITINDANPATTTNNKIWVYLYNNAGTQKSKGAKVDLSSGTGTFTVDTTLLDNGSSTLDVGRLEDAAGNFSGASDNYFKDYTIDNVVAPSGPNAPEVITDAATDVTVADATLNGTNGNNDATGHSFWVSLAPFDTTTPNIPSAVYSTPDMGAIAANGTFTATLSSLTTDAVTTGGATGTNLPAITPNTTYYYVAWSNVDGTWYPGATQTFTTASSTEGTTTTLTVPVLETPTNGTMLNTNNFTFTWDASTGGTSGPITYQFQSSLNPAETDGVLTTGIWSSGTLTTPSILSTGAPDGTWYWQVRAEDGGGNFSDWSPIWSVILDTAATSTATTPPAPTPTFPADNATLTSAALTQVTWTSVTDANMPITYTYEVSNSSTTAADGSFTDPINIGTAGTGLTNPQVSTGGTPEATYYWHVEAVDSIGNKSPWSTTQTFTIDNTSGGGGTPESPAPNAATITVPVLENSTSTPITLSATNVGADVTYAIASGPAHGTLSAVNGAEVDYTPAANSTADDTFTYTASSGGQTSSPATVTITITPVNIAPVSTNVTATSTADAAITITLAATDQDEGDTLTFATTSSPTHGTLGTISGNTVTYTPTSGYSGTDSFTVKANDGHTDSNESTVTINVTAPVVTPQVTTNTNTGGSHSGISGGIIRSSGGTTGGSSGSSGQVLGASTYNFTKNFGIGSRGTDVTQLQLILIADGYLKITTPTGYFGALTKAAVMKYQAANGISATGFVGPLTRAALNKGTLPTTPES